MGVLTGSPVGLPGNGAMGKYLSLHYMCVCVCVGGGGGGHGY